MRQMRFSQPKYRSSTRLPISPSVLAQMCETLPKALGPIAASVREFLHAGIGYGGSCFPKDVSALAQISGLHGYDFKLLSSVIEVNNHQRERFFQMVEYTLGNLRRPTHRRVGPCVPSPNGRYSCLRRHRHRQRLFAHGADVSVYDPQAMDSARAVLSIVFHLLQLQ